MNSNRYGNEDKIRNITKILFGFIFVGILGFGVSNGFNHDSALVKQCKVYTEKYVTAEYSDYSCGFDLDGNSSCDTDYWSEYASDKWKTLTINNELISTNVDESEVFKTKHGYFETNIPPHDLSFEDEYNFDNFKKHENRKLVVYVERNGKIDTFDESASRNSQCVKNVKNGDNIKVKVWYGISYGF